MKKIFISIFMVVLNFLLFVVSSSDLNNLNYITPENDNIELTSSYSPTLTGYDMTTYFSNLYEYSPNNSFGTCGYVSLIQYMSYYDAFYNDSIIPKKYDKSYLLSTSTTDTLKHSPGVESFTYSSIITGEYIYGLKEQDFQSKLIYLNNQNLNNAFDSYVYTIGMWNYKNLLTSLYGENKFNVYYKSVSDFGANSTSSSVVKSFDNYIKKQIDSGYPVILHIEKNKNGSMVDQHSVVAYYYDSEGIHCNFGWGKNYTDMTLDDYYVYSAGIIDFSLMEKTHSDNYILNGESICGCSNGHYHNHNYTYTCSSDNSCHIAKCSCGFNYDENHNWTRYYGKSSNFNFIYDIDLAAVVKYQCIYCNYISPIAF